MIKLFLTPATRKSVVEYICAVLAFLFVYTGFSKLLDLQNFEATVKEMPFFGNFDQFIGIGLPIAELLVVVFLILPKSRLIGLYLTTILLTTFTIYLGYVVFSQKNLPCSCGGVIQNLSWTQHVFFNLFFMLLTISAIKLYKIDTHNVK